MGVGDFFYEGASGVGAAIGGGKICGVLDGDGSSGAEFSGDGFVADSRGFAFQFFDGGGGVIRHWGVMGRTEKDNAETHRSQRRGRDRAKHERYGEKGRSPRFPTVRFSDRFSLFVLFDACGFAVPSPD